MKASCMKTWLCGRGSRNMHTVTRNAMEPMNEMAERCNTVGVKSKIN